MVAVGRFSAFIAPILLFVLAGSHPAPPTPYRSFPYAGAGQILNNGRALEVWIGHETDYKVDITGLYVDLRCAQNFAYPNINNVRVDLLEYGCARIIGRPDSAAEQAAEDRAKAAHRGLWAQPSGIGKATHWLWVNKLFTIPGFGLILAILASPILLKLGRWIRRVYYRRKVDIVIAGTVAVGKTGLWIAWKNEYIQRPPVTGLNPTPRPQETGVKPVHRGEWELRPTLIDAPGVEPWEVLQRIQRARGLKGLARSVERKRSKRVLLCVVSPTPLENSPNGSPFDESYVAKQEGYLTLPIAIIGQQDKADRPDLVIMFATKFDLLANLPPRHAESAVVDTMTAKFRAHRELVESACRRANIPFVWVVGSAKESWGIEELRRSLDGLIDNV
jgi:hypothetical protein